MSDKIFFPLVLLVAVAMVVGSLMLGREALPRGPIGGAGSVDYAVITVEGDDLARMEAGGKAEIAYLGDGVLSIFADAGALREEVERGPHFKLAADIETVFAGQKVRVIVEARPAQGGDAAGAEAVEVNYSSGNAGSSGWQRFDLKPDWTAISFDYEVPLKLLEDGAAYDYLGVRPVVPDKTRGVEIRKVQFRRLGRWAKE